jgi:hypothetical protein
MVEMRQRIDRADQEKEITEAIQVCTVLVQKYPCRWSLIRRLGHV